MVNLLTKLLNKIIQGEKIPAEINLDYITTIFLKGNCKCC